MVDKTHRVQRVGILRVRRAKRLSDHFQRLSVQFERAVVVAALSFHLGAIMAKESKLVAGLVLKRGSSNGQSTVVPQCSLVIMRQLLVDHAQRIAGLGEFNVVIADCLFKNVTRSAVDGFGAREFTLLAINVAHVGENLAD